MKDLDAKLIMFGWITTILGIPPNADPTEYNELTDKLYDFLSATVVEELEIANKWALTSNLNDASKHKWYAHYSARIAKWRGKQ